MKLLIAICLTSLLTGQAFADVAFKKNNRIVLFSQSDQLLVRSTCAPDTLPVSIGTCRDELAEFNLSPVHTLAAPSFGGLAAKHAERARLWTVEISRADDKILELLTIGNDQSPDIIQLKADIDRLGAELNELERLSYALADQIALLEDELNRHPDNDILAILKARRSEKSTIDKDLKRLVDEMERLRERILQAQGGIFDQTTFERVVNQRTEALQEYTICLGLVAAEEDRRVGYEKTLAYIGDHGFTYKIFDNGNAGDSLGIEVANVLYAAFDQAIAESYELKILRTQSQLVSCPGGTNAFCGMRARFTVPVDSRLKSVSCKIVASVTPCYRMTLYQADSNELIAIEGSVVTEEKGNVDWDHEGTPAKAWSLPAKGHWIVIGRCQHPGAAGNADLHFPGRLECHVKLRGP